MSTGHWTRRPATTCTHIMTISLGFLLISTISLGFLLISTSRRPDRSQWPLRGRHAAPRMQWVTRLNSKAPRKEECTGSSVAGGSATRPKISTSRTWSASRYPTGLEHRMLQNTLALVMLWQVCTNHRREQVGDDARAGIVHVQPCHERLPRQADLCMRVPWARSSTVPTIRALESSM